MTESLLRIQALLNKGMTKTVITQSELDMGTPLIPLEEMRNLLPVEENKLSSAMLVANDKTALTISQILQEGNVFRVTGLSPLYLYNEETGLFTVTSEEYYNSKMH